jgi:hypothetical protein
MMPDFDLDILTVILIVDVVRFLVSCAGTAFSALEWIDTVNDKRINIRPGINGVRLNVAINNIRMEMLRFMLHLIFMWTAVSSIVWPFSHAAYCGVPGALPKRLVTDRLLMIVGTLILAMKSWLARRTRKDIEDSSRHRRITDGGIGE